MNHYNEQKLHPSTKLSVSFQHTSLLIITRGCQFCRMGVKGSRVVKKVPPFNLNTVANRCESHEQLFATCSLMAGGVRGRGSVAFDWTKICAVHDESSLYLWLFFPRKIRRFKSTVNLL